MGQVKDRKKVVERRERVLDLVEQGYKNKEIVEILGDVTRGQVDSDIFYLREKGLLKKPRKNGDEFEKMVLDLKKKGYKHSEIAKQLNITIYQVNNISSLLKQEGETEYTGKTISSMKKLNRFKQIITRMKKYSNIQDAMNYAKSWENSIYLTPEERRILREYIKRFELKIYEQGKQQEEEER